jgi:protein-L-isoaspartate(D-aspartate) O-methyltransferase
LQETTFEDAVMDFALARANMIESQIRPNGITDERIIAAMAAIPRELFVPSNRRSLAYMDEDIEIDTAQPGGTPRYLLEPMTFARLVQLLALRGDDKVLDVGCCTGYSSAILSGLTKTVIALESDPELSAEAAANLAKLGLVNVRVITGRLNEGHLSDAPYDAICINGRIPEPPLPLLAQLKDHGRLAAVLANQEIGRVALFTRNGAFSVRHAFDASAPSLPGFEVVRPTFAF